MLSNNQNQQPMVFGYLEKSSFLGYRQNASLQKVQSGCKPGIVLLDDCHPSTAMWITQCIHMARVFIPAMSGKIGGDDFGVTHSNLRVF